MRRMLAIAIVLVMAPVAVSAEPPANAPVKKAKKATKATKATKGTKAKAPANEAGKPAEPAAKPGAVKPLSLQLKPPDGETAPNPGVDLFPKAVLEKAAEPGAQGAERRPGTDLGKDGDWKVHAAQAGVMVGLFGALAALCGGGACTVPDSWTSWLPDAIEADRGLPPPPRPVEPTRKAR